MEETCLNRLSMRRDIISGNQVFVKGWKVPYTGKRKFKKVRRKREGIKCGIIERHEKFEK